MRRKTLLSSSILATGTSLLAIGLALPVMAQENEPTVELINENESDDAVVEDRIIVTGSRIATDSALTAASPVQSIGIDDFRNSGDIDIGVSLRNIPALQGSTPAALASATGTATGLSLLNLRQLGAVRTLVLQDGRRHVPGVSGSQAVDIGAIPQALISRTEVLTGGASSIYGADAVSGVVNFITRKGDDFDGLEYRLQGGISDQGDAEDFFVSIANGGSFADGKGSAVFAAEFSRSTSITNGDRSFAGSGFSDLTQSSPILNNFLGLDPAAENAFIPNRTLPISSALGIIAFDTGFGGSPFFEIALAGGNGGFVNEFDPATDSVPEIAPGIPVVQVIDPLTGLRAFNPGLADSGFNAIGGDSITAGNADTQLLIPEQTRFVFAGGVEYELHENVEFFADGKFVFNDALDAGTIPFSDDIPIAIDNPFVPAELLAQAGQIGAIGFGVAKDLLDEEIDGFNAVDRTTIRATGGFRGKIPSTSLDYEVSFSWGRTEIDSIAGNARLNDRYFTAIDAVALTAGDLDGTNDTFAFGGGGASQLNAIRDGQDIVISADTAQVGDIVCRAELTGLPSPSNIPFGVGGPPIFPDIDEPGDQTVINGVAVDGATRPVTFQIGDGQCAPINILGLNTITGVGADFAFVDLEDDTTITQQQFLATVSGDSSDFFELPAGPIGFALGVEWRRDTSLFVPDSFFSIEGDVVNNLGTPVFTSPTDGQDITVLEGFAEVKVPLLRDLPLAEYLEFNGSVRLSDYNTIGGTTTFALGGRYQPHNWVTLRGTYSQAIRAPNLGELFGPQTAAIINVGDDPCDDGNINNGTANRPANCAEFVPPDFDDATALTAFVTGTTGGNPSLSEETAESFTVGGIFQPNGVLNGWLDEFVLIVDYYDIEIEEAIGSLTGVAIAEACVDLPSTDNQFCDSIVRVPITGTTGGQISTFTSGNINLSLLRARGIDFEARYGFDVPTNGGRDLGSIQMRLAGTRFLERFTEGDPIIQEVIAAETDPLEQELLIVDQAISNDLLGVIGTPEFVFNLGINWQLGKWNVGWTGRFEGSASNFSNADLNDVAIVDGAVVVSDNDGLADPSQLFTGSGFEQDISFNYQHSDRIGLYGGISNITDLEPFLGSLSRPTGPRGRFFFLGVQGAL